MIKAIANTSSTVAIRVIQKISRADLFDIDSAARDERDACRIGVLVAEDASHVNLASHKTRQHNTSLR